MLKKIISLSLFSCLFGLPNESSAQTSDMTFTKQTAEDFIRNLVGSESNIDVTNIKFNGVNVSNKVKLNAGTFQDNTNAFEINDGVILSTLNLDNAVQAPIFNPLNETINKGLDKGLSSGYQDEDLLNILPYKAKLNDIAVIEFDFVPQGDSLSFEYVFGSQEYPQFVCSRYNDVFGFFITGKNINNNPNNRTINIALLPDKTTPVSIGTVNNGDYGSNIESYAPNPLYLIGDLSGGDEVFDPLTNTYTYPPDGELEQYDLAEPNRKDFNGNGRYDFEDRIYNLEVHPLQNKSFLGEPLEYYVDQNGDGKIKLADDQINGSLVFTSIVADYDINGDNTVDLLDFYVDQDNNGKIDSADYTKNICYNGLQNSQYFVQNYTDIEADTEGIYNFFLNGYTKILKAEAKVKCGETYHMKLAIADVLDKQRSSAVFFKKHSFKTNKGPEVEAISLTTEGTKKISESCGAALYTFTRPNTSSFETIAVSFEGVAKNGVDYGILNASNTIVPVPNTIRFGTDELTKTLRIVAIPDEDINEGNEQLIFKISYTTSCDEPKESKDTITIIDVVPAEVNFELPAIQKCSSQDTYPLNVNATFRNQPFDINWKLIDVTESAELHDTLVSVDDKAGTVQHGIDKNFTYTLRKDVRSNGNYNLVLTYTDSICGIEKNSVKSFPLIFADPLNVQADNIDNIEICKGDEVTLNGSSSLKDNIKITWTFGDDSEPIVSKKIADTTVQHIYTDDKTVFTGEYKVELADPEKAGYENYCITSDSTDFTVSIKLLKKAEVSFEQPEIPQCTDFDSVQVSLSLTQPADVVQWVLIDSMLNAVGIENDTVVNNTDNLSTLKTYLKPGKTYFVAVKAYKNDECPNELQRVDTISVGKPVYLNGLIIPNVFTPNGDGKNDTFKFGFSNQDELDDPEQFLEYEYKIYNRWGKVIYEGGKNKPWDGKVDGNNAESAIYFYIIDFKAACVQDANKEGTWDGYINLLRD